MATCAMAGPLAPTALRCEYLVNPVGIDVANPRLYWFPGHTERGARQTAYQVLVGTTPDLGTPDQWDTGKVASLSPVHIAYGGKAQRLAAVHYVHRAERRHFSGVPLVAPGRSPAWSRPAPGTPSAAPRVRYGLEPSRAADW